MMHIAHIGNCHAWCSPGRSPCVAPVDQPCVGAQMCPSSPQTSWHLSWLQAPSQLCAHICARIQLCVLGTSAALLGGPASQQCTHHHLGLPKRAACVVQLARQRSPASWHPSWAAFPASPPATMYNRQQGSCSACRGHCTRLTVGLPGRALPSRPARLALALWPRPAATS